MNRMGQLTWNLLFLAIIMMVCGLATAQPIEAPAVITTPGVYELQADARGITDIYGIKIECSNVVIDGKGHFLGGEGREKSVGIYVNQYGGSITNITIKNVLLEDWETGIDYKYVKGAKGDTNLISGCDIVNSNVGIRVEYSDYVTAQENQVHECPSGIVIEGLSTYTDITQNTIKRAAIGIGIVNSHHSSLSENTINTCETYGLEVTDSEYTTVTKNNISDNTYAAVRFENSRHSVISGNTLSQTKTGPVLIIGNEVRDAVITNNYFSSFENISVDPVSADIVWNSTQTVGLNILGGPYLGGNYWGSTSGGKGFSDKVKDDDGFGIGDDPYVINDYNTDFLPLTHTTATKAPEEQEPVVSESTSSESEDGLINETYDDTLNVSAPADLIPVQPEDLNQSAVNNSTVVFDTNESLVTPVAVPADTPEMIIEQNESILNKSITNGYTPDESSVSFLNDSGASTNTSVNIPENVTSAVMEAEESLSSSPQINITTPAPVGYLVFTVSEPQSRVILTTQSGSSVSLDPMEGRNLTIPVQVEGLVYTAYQVVKEGYMNVSGNLTPYPGSGETIIIQVTLSPVVADVSSSPAPLSGQNVSVMQPAVIPDPLVNQTPPPTPVPVPITPESVISQPVVVANKVSPSSLSHQIHASSGPGGSIYPDGTISVPHGDSLAFTFAADEGKEVAYLVIDGIKTGPMSEYRFINVTSDHTIVTGFT
jgi:parallel beta-helix repeat protein